MAREPLVTEASDALITEASEPLVTEASTEDEASTSCYRMIYVGVGGGG